MPTIETLFLLVLSILAMESADSIRSLYRHFLAGITEKSLYPIVTRDKCFVTCGKWSNSLCTIHVSEIDENGNILSDWKSEAIADMNSVFLLSYSDTKMEFITFHENHVDYLVYSFEGILLSRKIIYQVETNFNYSVSTTANFSNLIVYYKQNQLFDITYARLFYIENLSKIVPLETQNK